MNNAAAGTRLTRAAKPAMAPPPLSGKGCVPMASHHRTLWPLLVAATLVTALFMPPSVARASDALSWTRRYAGPPNIPVPGFDPIPVAGAFDGVAFSGSASGWAVGVRVDNASFLGGTRSGLIVSTHDGGASWAPVAVTTPYELRAVDALSATDVWAVGDAGTMAHWDGSAWTIRSVSGWPATKAFHGIAFASDGLHGWAVGDGLGVVRTVDGGVTWSVVTTSSSATSLRAVAAVNATSALAVGDSGSMRLLTGASSTSRSSGTSASLYGITFADAGHGWATGSSATVVKSSNGGATWSIAPVPIPSEFPASVLTGRSVTFANVNEGIVVGTYQMVWRTSDGGASWTAEQLYDPGWLGDLELRCAAFPGSAAAPVVVSRHRGLDLSSSDQKARAFLGSWTDRTSSAPMPPTGLLVSDGGAPGPRVAVAWTDASSDEGGFTVERSNGPAGVFSVVATLGAGVTSWTDTDVDWVSAWYYRVRSFRGDVSSGWVTSSGLILDATAPVTTSDAQAAYVGSAAIHLAATDGPSGSGVAHTYWRLDSGALQTDVQAIAASAAGGHTLEFWSVDVAANEEMPHKTVGFEITIPDTTAPATVSDAETSYTGPATIHLSATDDPGGSGVAHTYWTLDEGTQNEGVTAVVTAAGQHTLQFWSVDVAGNVEEHKTVGFEITIPDINAPVTTSDARASYTGPATIHLTATDDPGGSGVAHTYWSLDGAPRNEGLTVAAASSGGHTLEFWSVDAAVNEELPHKTASFSVATPPPPDTTPPATVSDARASYTGPATIHLSATDDPGGSGVAHTYWSLDGAPRNEGLTVVVTAAGQHTLQFWSVDVAGNVEAHKTSALGVTLPDTIAPVTVSDAQPSYLWTATIALTPTDLGGSGIAATYYRLDGGAQHPYTASLSITTGGSHTLEFWSVDVAGNSEAPHKQATIVVTVPPPVLDTTPPVTAWEGKASSFNGAAAIILTADDANGTGVASTLYQLDGGAQRLYAGAVVVATGGVHSVEFWSVDVAGNVELPHNMATFTITLPAATLTVPRAPARVRHAVPFNVTGFITKHPAGTLAVKLYCYQRLKSGTYKWRKTVQVVISNHTSVMSKYTARFSLPSAGRWRIKAGHSDAGHRASYSGYEYLAVY